MSAISPTPLHTHRPQRVLSRITGERPGPTFICIGGVHGNEPAGLTALHRVSAQLEGTQRVERGEFLALAGNLRALEMGRRFVDWDLNRYWGANSRRNGRGATESQPVEDREQAELLRELQGAFARARGLVYVLDLHTTSGPGRPFTVFADTLQSRSFARRIPSPLILGLEEHLDGTLVDYVASQGHIAVAFEGGQHEDPTAPDNMSAVIWLALAGIQIVKQGSYPQVAEGQRILRAVSRRLPPALEIKHRHPVAPEDDFVMAPGFSSFDLVKRGQPLAESAAGAVVAPRDGYLLMPLYQEQGEDGFFVVSPVKPIWLVISRWLRVLRVDKIVHWLPGVQRDPAAPKELIVNRRVARWVALQVLHLLGYRRLSEDGMTLRVKRREYDRT